VINPVGCVCVKCGKGIGTTLYCRMSMCLECGRERNRENAADRIARGVKKNLPPKSRFPGDPRRMPALGLGMLRRPPRIKQREEKQMDSSSVNGNMVCNACGITIVKEYAGRLECCDCGRKRMRAYDQDYLLKHGYSRKQGERLRKPGPPPRPWKSKVLSDEDILEGARIGRELTFLTLPIWDQVEVETFGLAAWPTTSEMVMDERSKDG